MPALIGVFEEWGCPAMTVLCLVETDADGAADASLRALSFAAGLARGPAPAPVAAVVFGPEDQVPRDALAAHGAASAHLIEPGHAGGYAPQAWARALAGLAAQTEAVAVIAAATDRGNEVMAYLGALTGLPMAANCVSAESGRRRRLPGRPAPLGRPAARRGAPGRARPR